MDMIGLPKSHLPWIIQRSPWLFELLGRFQLTARELIPVQLAAVLGLIKAGVGIDLAETALLPLLRAQRQLDSNEHAPPRRKRPPSVQSCERYTDSAEMDTT
jgi:hypothetical protein